MSRPAPPLRRCTRLRGRCFPPLRRILLPGILLVCLTSTPGTRAREPIPGPPPGYLEVGLPPFVVLGTEALGLSAPPESFNALPDGRILLVGNRELAVGDGQRWEVFQQAEDGLVLNTLSAIVDDEGSIYLGTPGGFSRVVMGDSGKWTLVEAGRLPDELTSAPLIMHRAARLGDRWFWWSGGSLVEWTPGKPAVVIGQFDAIERILSIDGVVYFSDSANGRLYRLGDSGQLELVSLPGDSYVDAQITAAAPIPGTRKTLVGTAAGGLLVHENGVFRPFQGTGILAGRPRINDLCTTANGFIAVAIDNAGILFLDPSGRIVQDLTRSADYRFAHVRRLMYDRSGTLWALLADGIARVGFPSAFSDFAPLIRTGLSYTRPFRFQGGLWLMAEGRAQRAVYDEQNRLTGFEIDTPPGYLTEMIEIDGMWLASTQNGIYRWDGPGSWTHLIPDVTSAHIRSQPIADGLWA